MSSTEDIEQLIKTEMIASYIDKYYEYADQEDFSKQFIDNFFYILHEMLGDVDSLDFEGLLTKTVDITVSMLFNLAVMIKTINKFNHDVLNESMEFIRDNVIEGIRESIKRGADE